MLVHKCDRCKKTLTDRELTVKAGVGYDSYEFCKKCGAPIVRILKGYGLVKNLKTGLAL